MLTLDLWICVEVMSSRGFDYKVWKVVHAKKKGQVVVSTVVLAIAPATKRHKTSEATLVKEAAPKATKLTLTP